MTDVKECRWCGGRNVPAAEHAAHEASCAARMQLCSALAKRTPGAENYRTRLVDIGDWPLVAQLTVEHQHRRLQALRGFIAQHLDVPAAALRWDPERRAFVEIETMNGRPVLEGGRVVVKQAFPKRGQ